MAEVINTNVFNADKKFVDFSGLDYFWTKAKNYIDGVDTAMSAKVVTIEGDVANLKTTVGNANSGLVQKVNALQSELDGLSGGAGSITTQIENALGTLDVADAAVVGQYVSSVSETDGKITVTRAALPDYTEVYDAKGAAAGALDDAKSYADGLAVNYDAAGTAAGLNDAMDARVTALEGIDHNQIAADAAATAVAGVIDGAPEKFDTLKEIAQWISDSETADSAADLVTRVTALEAIDHDAYVAADAATLASAKTYADGLAVNYDAKGAAATAEQNAKDYADGKFQVAGDYEAAGTAAAAIAALDLPNTYDAKGAAAAAQAAAIAQAKLDAADALKAYYTKTEVDNLLSTNSAADQAYAKTYTDQLFNSFQFAQNSDIDGLFA